MEDEVLETLNMWNKEELEHFLRSAYLAEMYGASEEVILATLFHGISLHFTDDAKIFISLGLSKKVCELIKNPSSDIVKWCKESSTNLYIPYNDLEYYIPMIDRNLRGNKGNILVSEKIII